MVETTRRAIADSKPSEATADGYYVWHCHITDHEDNEMMRPSRFQPRPGATRSYVQGTHY